MANALVPELVCSDIQKSLEFYTVVLGFDVLYARPEERFAYLRRAGAEVRLEQPLGRSFLAAPLSYPFGRGLNLQIEVDDVDGLYEAVCSADAPLLIPMEERWYGVGRSMRGNRQFVVQDPDGYLLRFFTDIGERPAVI